jgi:TonB family protein
MSTIAIADPQGRLIKWLSAASAELGFHERFGFISREASEQRLRSKALNQGLKAGEESWLCRFKVESSASGLNVSALENCRASREGDGSWNLATAFGEFKVLAAADGVSLAVDRMAPAEEHSEKDDRWLWLSLLALLFVVVGLSFRTPTQLAAPAVILEPLNVKIQTPEKQKSVRVPSVEALPQQIQTSNKQARKAIAQDLGFLGMLGKKNLSKALGGMPTSLKNASAGAGAGGTQGSGGELLVGLGQGVKRTTVGNSGTVGLGGVGTKGAGGGNGGYGNTMVGSGGGRALSAMPVSQDLVLEGGLDRAVIQATIAKYLSQVRACYEEGLHRNSALSGTVTMNFEVGASGAVNSARVGKSSLGDAAVEQCISQRMMSWKFPKPLGGVNVKVAYPFLLRPAAG